MTTSPNDPIRELKAVLAEHLPWHGARISFLAQFLLALIKVRSVSLAELATGFSGSAKVDSHYKRLQRFFRSFEIGYDDLARLLVRIGTRLDAQLSEMLFQHGLTSGKHGQALRDLDMVRGFSTGATGLALLDAPWIPVYIALVYVLPGADRAAAACACRTRVS